MPPSGGTDSSRPRLRSHRFAPTGITWRLAYEPAPARPSREGKVRRSCPQHTCWVNVDNTALRNVTGGTDGGEFATNSVTLQRSVLTKLWLMSGHRVPTWYIRRTISRCFADLDHWRRTSSRPRRGRTRKAIMKEYSLGARAAWRRMRTLRASSKPRSAPQTREQAEADVESAIAREYELLSKKSAIQKEASTIGRVASYIQFRKCQRG